MRLCYFVNQYPKVSHSFIRREILELEKQGTEVLRIALRGWEQPAVDQFDDAEQKLTRYVLREGLPSVLVLVCGQLLRRPARFLKALSASLALGRRSDKSLIKHLVCLVEACVVSRWIQANDVTHLHAHFGTNSAEVAMLASLLSGIPYSFTVHGPEEFDHPQGLCLRKKAHHAAHVMAISSFGRSQLYRWVAPEDWHKIVIVRCGLDQRFFDSPPSPPVGSRAFVCVGRLCEQKGQLLLLDALRLVLDKGRDCRLVLAGDGEMRQAIDQRVKELALESHVSITGWISGDQVIREIALSRALVLPSFAEGLPVVLMEALALARPVITTFVAGIPELVEDGECGWLVPAGDAESLAHAMIDCLESDEGSLAAMGQNGRDRVLERHDIRKEATTLQRLFSGADV